ANALAAYANERYWCYAPAEGIPEFREAMAWFYQTQRHIPATAASVLATDSAAYGIYLVCQTLLTPGDEAIIFDPVDFLFAYSVGKAGGTAVTFAIPPGTDYVDFTRLEQLITPRTKLICLCNPLNPTGKVFTPAELEILGNIAIQHGLFILSDEIWSDIVFAPATFTSIASLSEAIRQRTILVTGFSKSYGLAGLRIGAVTAFNTLLFDELLHGSLHQSTVHGANTAGQVAATAALREAGGWLANKLQLLQHNRDTLVAALNEIDGFHCIPPDGCYVAFANISGTGKTATEVTTHLMEKAKVRVVPGLAQWFGPGAEGYIRLSFATSPEILGDAISRIKSTIHEL
ncbi:MAG: aminotransferase class I/II-fold pyridoxal phosphate-dependent enzyme, partial [Chitinophagia bacterium]|nr:aminotransferase class I/II-fold pyridoxal phosphate-dependent enzyme [Chitinophagia bacterium]